MGTETKIQWADHTFNPWRGCTKIAPGCANCYADTQSKRNPAVLGVWGANGTRVVASEAQWKLPVKWDREAKSAGVRRTVFCASLADVFEDWPHQMLMSDGSFANNAASRLEGNWTSDRYAGVRLKGGTSATRMDAVRLRLFRLIDATPNLDWLLVTKRPKNVRRMWGWCDGDTGRLPEVQRETGETVDGGKPFRRNVWLLTSISDQQTADAMIPQLLKCRDLCPVLGLSAEPLLGPVDLKMWNPRDPKTEGEWMASVEGVGVIGKNRPVDWVIIGGESGPGARSCNVAWIRDLVRQCKQAGVPAFVKQLGALPTVDGAYSDWPFGVSVQRRGGHCEMILEDNKGGDPDEWPEDLRVREFPETKGA